MKTFLFSLVILGLTGILYYYNFKKSLIEEVTSTSKISNEEFLIQEFQKELNLQYPELNFQINGDKIVAINGIAVKAKIINHKTYPQSESFQLNFYTSHKLFHRSIEERLVGIGDNNYSALQYGIQSFLSGQFPVIIEGLEMKHLPDMDFEIIEGHKKSHWHPLIGDIQLQGELSKRQDSFMYEKTYNLIKPLITTKLKESGQDFHWLRYYISKLATGEIIGDCYYDNEPYEEGLNVLKKLAISWGTTEFAGQKQFILLRQCKVANSEKK